MKRGSLDEKLKYVRFIIDLGNFPIKPEHTFEAKFEYEGENLLKDSKRSGTFLDPTTGTLHKASNFQLRSDMIDGAFIYIVLPLKFLNNLTMGEFLEKLNRVQLYRIYSVNIEVKFDKEVVGASYVLTGFGNSYAGAVIPGRINSTFVLTKITFSSYHGIYNYNFYRNYFKDRTIVEPDNRVQFDMTVNLKRFTETFYTYNLLPPGGIFNARGDITQLTADNKQYFDSGVEYDSEVIVLNHTKGHPLGICFGADDYKWKKNPYGEQYPVVTCTYYVKDAQYLMYTFIKKYKDAEAHKKATESIEQVPFYETESINKLIEEYCKKLGNKDDVVGVNDETCYELHPDVDYYTKLETSSDGCTSDDGKYKKYDELSTEQLKSSCYPGGKPNSECYDSSTNDIPTEITEKCYPSCYSNGVKNAFKENDLGKLCYPFYLYNDIECEPNDDEKVKNGVNYLYDYDRNCKVRTCQDGFTKKKNKCVKDRTQINLLIFGSIVAIIIIFILII